METNKRLSIPPGTTDVYGAEMRRRDHVLCVIRRVYEQYGFQPLHTPVLENADVFKGHHGVGEQLLFHLNDKNKVPLVLRYDLTVPLARVVSMHPDIMLPFKRYQLAEAFRDDDVDRGHFREFMQCDGDAIGIADLSADAEVITMAHMGLDRIGFKDFTIRVNHRGIIKGLALYACGSIDYALKIQEALDFADKVIKCGMEGVRSDLLKRGLEQDVVERLVAFLDCSGSPEEVLYHAEKMIGVFPESKRAIDELREIIGFLPPDALSKVAVDFTLARGANYYTGFILEGVINGIPVGAVLGGGRYDNLVAAAGGKSEPAIGMAFGLERILTSMEELSMSVEADIHALLLFAETDDAREPAFHRAHMLRGKGFAVEFNPEIRTMAEAEAHATARDYGIVMSCDEEGRYTVAAIKEGVADVMQEIIGTCGSME